MFRHFRERTETKSQDSAVFGRDSNTGAAEYEPEMLPGEYRYQVAIKNSHSFSSDVFVSNNLTNSLWKRYAIQTCTPINLISSSCYAHSYSLQYLLVIIPAFHYHLLPLSFVILSSYHLLLHFFILFCFFIIMLLFLCVLNPHRFQTSVCCVLTCTSVESL